MIRKALGGKSKSIIVTILQLAREKLTSMKRDRRFPIPRRGWWRREACRYRARTLSDLRTSHWLSVDVGGWCLEEEIEEEEEKENLYSLRQKRREMYFKFGM